MRRLSTALQTSLYARIQYTKSVVQPAYEKLPSGKAIFRDFYPDGTLRSEMPAFGFVELAITATFKDGQKVEETYLHKKRLVGRKCYEKHRLKFPDMPPADASLEDWAPVLNTEIRRQQRDKAADAKRRWQASAVSQYPRPESTNWLRIFSKDKSHLVVFESRDWKALSREISLPSSRRFLDAFGFGGQRSITGESTWVDSVAAGVVIGYEVRSPREEMLNSAQALLRELEHFTANVPPPTIRSDSFRPRPKPRKKPPLSWLRELPALIEFLQSTEEHTLKIYNHHQ